MEEIKNTCPSCTEETNSHGQHKYHGQHGGPCGKKDRFARYAAMEIDEKLFFMLTKLCRMSHGAHGGKDGQNRVLHMLLRSGGMTQRELTERLDIQPGSASELIKKLETAGLIVREVNIEDRRTTNITLTEAGRAQVEETRQKFKDTNRALFTSLSEEEKQQLLSLLEKLLHEWGRHFHAESHRRGRRRHNPCGEHNFRDTSE